MARRALFIGNMHFRDSGLKPLRSPVGDSQRLMALLQREDVGGYVAEMVADASSQVIREVVEGFFERADPDDLVLLYISTHGLKDRYNRLYFAAADTVKNKLLSTGVGARFLVETISGSLARQRVLIIDSCYSGRVMKGILHKSGDDGLSAEDFGPAKGVAIMTASSGTEFAYETKKDGAVTSLFSRA